MGYGIKWLYFSLSFTVFFPSLFSAFCTGWGGGLNKLVGWAVPSCIHLPVDVPNKRSQQAYPLHRTFVMFLLFLPICTLFSISFDYRPEPCMHICLFCFLHIPAIHRTNSGTLALRLSHQMWLKNGVMQYSENPDDSMHNILLLHLISLDIEWRMCSQIGISTLCKERCRR